MDGATIAGRQPGLVNTPLPLTLGFKTGSGAEGVLQLTRFGEGNQPAVTLRYKVFRAQVSPLSGTNPAPATLLLEFGHKAERTLAADKANRDGVVGYRFKDNDEVAVPETLTGHFKQLSTRGFTTELEQWMRDNRVDMLFCFAEESYDVLTLDMRNGYIGQPGEWDTVLPAQAAPVLNELEDLNSEPGPGISSGAGYREMQIERYRAMTREQRAGKKGLAPRSQQVPRLGVTEPAPLDGQALFAGQRLEHCF